VFYAFDELNHETGAIYYDEAGSTIPMDLVVARVTPGSAAARLGIVAEDRIMACDSKKPTSAAQLTNCLAKIQSAESENFLLSSVGHRLMIRHGDQETAVTVSVPAARLGVNLTIVRADSAGATSAK
jgi:C-terminal processing protease CtpA/Prc